MQRFVPWMALGASVAVLYGATLPAARRSALHSAGVLHPWVHLALFGIIALLAAWSVRHAPARVLLCVGVAALGCATELLEWRLYHAPLEWTDMLLDAMGSVIGTGLGAMTEPLLRRRTPDSNPR